MSTKQVVFLQRPCLPQKVKKKESKVSDLAVSPGPSSAEPGGTPEPPSAKMSHVTCSWGCWGPCGRASCEDAWVGRVRILEAEVGGVGRQLQPGRGAHARLLCVFISR